MSIMFEERKMKVVSYFVAKKDIHLSLKKDHLNIPTLWSKGLSNISFYLIKSLRIDKFEFET